MSYLIPDFSQSNILILGDIMLDRYWHGGSSRISPEAPVQVVNVSHIEERPGGAGNVALNSASLGCRTQLLGLTGKDEAATALETKLTAANIQCDFEAIEQLPTITKLRVISRKQQLIRLDFEQSFAQVDKSALLNRFKNHCASANAIILSDYAKGTLSDIQSLIKIASQFNVPLLIDPKGNDFSRYRGATLITPNLSEFEAVVGPCIDEKQLVEKGQALIEALNWQALLVTRGEDGMTLIRPNQPELHLPALAQEVYDVTGAGDTVIATLACALATGETIEHAVLLANTAASLVVAKLGTATISSHELRRKLANRENLSGGKMTPQQLKFALDEAKTHGESIVMTNGCFDILHAGHVEYLQQAKALGQRLIVAVNSDDSVRQLKGDGRPINPCDRRMSVLSALGAVDWVVEFDQATPEALIADILPDILVKGGDYQVDQIAGGKQVIENGGQVKVLDFVDGISTSKIIQQLEKNGEKP